MVHVTSNTPKEDAPARQQLVRILGILAGMAGLILLAIFLIRLPLILGSPARKPNVLVIMVDDLDEASFDQLLAAHLLPNIERYIVEPGVRFTDSIVTNSACCPSRASFLTGQYAHNHGVNSIGGTHGGVPGFHPGGDMDRPTLARWLNDASPEADDNYYTGLIGKYMNHYGSDEDGRYPVPSGWDVWRALNNTGTHQLEPGKYEIVDNEGTAVSPQVYQTTQLGTLALRFLSGGDDAAPFSWQNSDEEQFFLFLTPTAPHVVSLPEELTHYGACDKTHPQWQERVVPDSAATKGYEPDDYRLPDVPSCDRQFPDGCLRVDGPDGITSLPGFDLPGIQRLGSQEAFLETYNRGEHGKPNETVRPAWVDFHWDSLSCGDNLDYVRRQHLDRLESMISVDVMAGQVLGELAAQGELEDTLIVFTSDNGFMLGEHRLGNKQVAYDESIRVPLVIRPPHSTFSDGTRSNLLVANIDLAPTILDYSGRAWETYPVDGRSLRPLLENQDSPEWRDRLLVEHWHPDGLEDRLTQPEQWWRVPTHMALYTAAAGDWPSLTLVEYDDGDWGQHDQAWIDFYGSAGYRADFLYDLQADRSQVANLIEESKYADITAVLREALRELAACSGANCRQADVN